MGVLVTWFVACINMDVSGEFFLGFTSWVCGCNFVGVKLWFLMGAYDVALLRVTCCYVNLWASLILYVGFDGGFGFRC